MALSLKQYVERRNGVPLGASGSLTNMLKNALGAKNFSQFWLYWNPIWGYYLATKIQKPLTRFLPHWFALIATFTASGLLHDVAVMLLKQKLFIVCTPWFSLMGIAAVLSKNKVLNLSRFPWIVKAGANCSIIIVCFICSRYLSEFV
ncbi:hypothetical protein AN214_01015 [Pseudoalteromonas sp. P1-9]|uniref:MBOAT family O-acyltransferase n=1 Tax=Pseudoalteromonas sp. P1-9 TaxID=1710354 RepID=UPI0006D621F0|nr:MBOAT family O-acyltransferase [Pseudoalteromonas sp. P1-9]KPV96998.1 hypothetical protein AN214_01015 [Pseudoalteromonas sp. P1-9]